MDKQQKRKIKNSPYRAKLIAQRDAILKTIIDNNLLENGGIFSAAYLLRTAETNGELVKAIREAKKKVLAENF